MQYDIKESKEKTEALVELLTKLRNECVRTSDNLNNILLRIKHGLQLKMEKSSLKVKELQKKIEDAGCTWWSALLTLGMHCLFSTEEEELRAVQQKF